MFALTRAGARRRVWDDSSITKHATHRGWGLVFARIVFFVLAVLPASWAVCNDNYFNHTQEVGTTEQIPLADAGSSTLYVSDEQRDILPTYPQQSSYNTYESLPASMEPSMADESGKFVAPGRTVYLPPSPQIQGVFAQVDYFYWREAASDGVFEESGPLVTLGYHARKAKQRYRLALFFGNVNFYTDSITSDVLYATQSDTDYLGASFEYDFRWQFPHRPTDGIFVGVGTRLWSRNIDLAWDTPIPWLKGPSIRMKQFWWTVYPRAGIDINRQLPNGWHLYSSFSLGLTAYTSANFDASASFLGETIRAESVTVEPKTGIYGQYELTLRKNRLFISLMLEQMAWQDSDPEESAGQPDSSMLTAGMLAGFSF